MSQRPPFRTVLPWMVGVCVLGLLTRSSGITAQVFQPGTQPTGRDGGLQVPVQTSTTCIRCHASYDTTTDAEPWDTWRGTMMGNAGRDPIFRAALSVAEADNPAAADFCVRCHSPPAWLRGRSSLPEWSAANGPRFDPDDPTFLSDDLDGVGCMTCHRSTDQSASQPGAPYLLNARLNLIDGTDSETRLGPYSYGAGEDPRHPTRQSQFLSQSAFCGQCHDIVNPVVTGKRIDGSSTGRPFVIERTFSEWQASAFPARSQTCQHCHMPDMATDVPAAQDGPARAYMRRHDLVGGNSWVPRAIAAVFSDAGVATEVTDALRATSDRARAFLQTSARLEIRSATLSSGRVSASVRVTNLTGHKLPTGYPEGRRMWLEVAVLNAAGDVVSGSGLYDTANATLVSDPQVRTYEVSLGQDTTPSFHFILNNTVLKDTRIPPEGFSPRDDLDMAPIGRDYSDGAGGYRNYDEVSYTLDACALGALRLRARLRYQTNTKEYVEFLRTNARPSLEPDAGNWGQRAAAQWAEFGTTPSEMAEVTMDVGTNSTVCTPSDASVADGSRADAGTDVGADSVTPGTGCRCATPGDPHTRTRVPLSVIVLGLVGFSLRRTRKH